MNLLSKEDIEDGGSVLAWFTMACLAWIPVYSVSLLLNVHWLVALPIVFMVGSAVRDLGAAASRGIKAWHDGYVARHPDHDRLAAHPPPEPWYQATVDAIAETNRSKRRGRGRSA